MSSVPGDLLEISSELTPEKVGKALEKATRGLTKSWAPELVGVDRNTPTNWGKGSGMTPLQWLAIAFRSDPSAVYSFLAEIGARPGAADEQPEDRFTMMVADLREAWGSDPAEKRRVEGAIELAKRAVGVEPSSHERKAATA